MLGTLDIIQVQSTGADPGFFLGGGALVSCSTSTPINHIVFFFLQNTSCIRKPQVISGGVRTPCTLPLDPPLEHCQAPFSFSSSTALMLLHLYFKCLELKKLKSVSHAFLKITSLLCSVTDLISGSLTVEYNPKTT